MLSARTAWKHRKLIWKCRGLWKYRGLWVHRKDVLAGVIAGGAVPGSFLPPPETIGSFGLLSPVV